MTCSETEEEMTTVRKANIVGVTAEEVRLVRLEITRRTNALKAMPERRVDQEHELEVLEEFRQKLSAAVRRLDSQTKETD